MKYIFFLILSTLAFLFCNKPVLPHYSLECYARFDQQAARVTAEAIFKEGDSLPKPIEVPGGIRYQGIDMRLVPIRGMTYQHSYAADFTREQLFEWKTKEGKDLEFKLQMAPLDSISFEPKVLSRRQTARFNWEGAALGKGEVLVFIWENKALGLTVPMELYQVGPSKIIEFPAVKIAELAAGDWSYYVVRKKLQKEVLDNVSMSGVTEFYTKAQKIKVTD